MFHGFFKYGETEVANNYRVSQYVKNGLTPVGAFIEDCGDCGDLPLVTAGLDAYETPALDDAPWVTTEDPDSVDFAGIFVREVTGLEGSTTTVDVSEKIGDGGAIGTRRANSRTVAVTADVVARTREAADIGIEWLSSILHPPCAAGSDCGGDVLHLFSTCPSACTGRTDPDAAFEEILYEGMANYSGSEQFAASKTINNRLLNGSMQLGTSTTLTNWATVSNFFFNFAEQIGSVAAPTGVGSIDRSNIARIQLPALTPDNNGVWIEQQVTGLTVGRRYVISGWFYVPSATGVQPYISVAGIIFGSSEKVTAKDRWVYMTKTFTAEQTTHTIGFGANGGTTASGSVFYADALALYEDTGFINTQSFCGGFNVEGWAGTDSVDTTFAPPASIAVNAIPHSSMEQASLVPPWSPSNGTFQPVTDGQALEGTKVGEFIANASGSQYVTHQLISGISAGQTYTASAYLKQVTAALGYYIQILWYNGNTFLSTSSATYAAGSLSGTAFTRMVVTGTAPTNANLARVQIAPVGAAGVIPVGQGFRIDAVQFTNTGGVTPYAPIGELVLAWQSALPVGKNRQAAHGLVHATRPGELYTLSFEVFVPAGSPDVQGKILFHNQGQSAVVTAKDTWTTVTMTYRAESTFTRWGVATAPGGHSPGAGKYVKIRNPRVWPGLAPMPNNYFDGATTDVALGNRAAGVAVSGLNATVATGVFWEDETWTRVTTAGTVGTGRVSVLESSLTDFAVYDASWLVANDGNAPVTVTVDWNDLTDATWLGSTSSYTIQPGERRRIYTTGAKDYTSTFRFTDITLPANSTLLVKDVEVKPRAPYDFAWTGAADASVSTATPLSSAFDWTPAEGNAQTQILVGPLREGVCDTVEVEWVVSSTSGALVSAGWGDPSGALLEADDAVPVGSSPVVITTRREASEGFPADWHPLLLSQPLDNSVKTGVPAPLVIHSMTVSHRPILTVEECVGPYRRTLHNVVTAKGPEVVQWLTLGDDTTDSTVARVEWTWVATDPHAWHEPIPIVTDAAGKSAIQAYTAPTVQISGTSNAAVNATACARPAATALTCADNTLGPAIILPPQAPVLSDSGIMNLAGSNRTRRYFEIPEDLSPLGVGKFSWRFDNDSKPKFGIRVRIYEDTDPAFVPPAVECNFIEEFTIEYLAPNQTLYIDGPGDDVYVWCGDDAYGNPIYAPALKNVRGNYGGPFKNSLIGCSRPYLITVDVPNTYTNVPSNISGQTTGSDQGDVLWSVDLVRRA